MTGFRLFLGIVLLLLKGGAFAAAGQMAAMPDRNFSCVAHVHSNFSSGAYSVAELAEKAENAGIDAVLLSDHDLVAMEYGIFPLRNILRVRVEQPSVISAGADRYLAEIGRANREYPGVVMIPGIQSSPFYYWKGNPVTGLRVCDYRKELLIFGMRKPEDYERIPVMHNGFSTRYFFYYLPGFVLFSLLFAAGCIGATRGPVPLRRAWLVLSLVSFLLAIDRQPFKSSRYDPYHGDAGIGPYQEVINYAKAKGGAVFWAHPESGYSSEGRKIGPVTFETDPYPSSLIESSGYTGFSALYGDNHTAELPGGLWDRLISDYCAGRRKEPVWAIAGADFHKEEAGVEIDTFQTVVWASEKSAEGILAAVKSGKCFAVLKNKGRARLDLLEYLLVDDETGEVAYSGMTLEKAGNPVLRFGIGMKDSSKGRIQVIIVDGGRAIEYSGIMPFHGEYRPVPRRGRSWLRLIAKDPRVGILLTNPIFVKR